MAVWGVLVRNYAELLRLVTFSCVVVNILILIDTGNGSISAF